MILLYFLVYLIPRIIFAFRFPIFNDEAIIVHIGRYVVRAPDNILRFSIDGRQPAFVTTAGLFQHPSLDPLMTTRLMTIGFGAVAFIALLAVARKMGLSAFGQKILTIAVATSPFLVLYDTLVLPDVQVTASAVVSVLVLLYGIEKPTVGRGMLLGLTLVLGWWYFSLILLMIPGLVFFFLVSFEWKRTRLIPVMQFWIGCLVTFLLFSLPLFLLNQHNQTMVKRTLDIGELLAFPWRLWLGNFWRITQWFLAFVPAPLLVCSLFGLRNDPTRRWRGLTIASLMPLGIAIAITTTFSARNTVFVVPTLILLSVRGLMSLPKQTIWIVASLTVSLLSAIGLLFFPLKYYDALSILPDAKTDFKQYVAGWPSGYGIQEAVEWFTQKRKTERFAVVVRNDSGNPEDAMFTYLEPKNIPVIYPDQIVQVRRLPVSFGYYFVSRGSQFGDFGEKLTEVIRFTKPLDPEFVGIYRLNF